MPRNWRAEYRRRMDSRKVHRLSEDFVALTECGRNVNGYPILLVTSLWENTTCGNCLKYKPRKEGEDGSD